VNLPLWAKKFIIDTVETGAGILIGLTFIIPGNLDELRALGLVVGSALLGAVVSAARRVAPEAKDWLVKVVTDFLSR